MVNVRKSLFVLILTSNILLSYGDDLPINTSFSFPTPLPSWPLGGGFAVGEINLGGLIVRKVTTFQRVWATNGRGPDGLGTSFFEPSPIPIGFFMLATYAQPNNQKFFGWVLVGKPDTQNSSVDSLKPPTNYTLIKVQDSGYFWEPVPPNGYKPVGYVVTTSPDVPGLDKIRCVRSDFTNESEMDAWIWGGDSNVNVYTLRPKTRGANAKSVNVNTFYIKKSDNSNISISCLKSNNSNPTSMPNLSQIEALFKTYSPYLYFHPKENYLPSSVNWFFANGALLYKKGDEGNPVAINPNGTNLPQGGENDGLYWLDLPTNQDARNKVRRGDLQSAEAYLHAKSILGATFTDIQLWLFYPFNGPGTLRIAFIKRIELDFGDHVCDWEHVTLRISNFDGVLHKVFFAQHNKGQWVDSPSLEFYKDNKFVGYPSLNGHATYLHPGTVLIGGGDRIGVRNDASKSDIGLDTGARFSVVAADWLSEVVAPAWLSGYNRLWGPTKPTDFGKKLEKIRKVLPGKLKKMLSGLLEKLPEEMLGQAGPSGPHVKGNWNGDES